MHQFLMEARITLPNPGMAVEFLCRELASICNVISADGNTHILRFDASRALLRAAGNDLLLRVEAEDLVACHAIEVVLEGHLAQIDWVIKQHCSG